MGFDAFSEYCSELKDSRQTAKVSYPLFDVLFLTVCAVIADAEGWEDFGDVHLDWFQKKGTVVLKPKSIRCCRLATWLSISMWSSYLYF